MSENSGVGFHKFHCILLNAQKTILQLYSKTRTSSIIYESYIEMRKGMGHPD